MALEDADRDVDRAIDPARSTGLAFENAFAGALSFMRRRYSKDLDGADLAVTGIGFDQAVTNRPGTRLGPRAIREASTLQPCDPPHGWGMSPLEAFDIVDYGDMAFDYARVPEVTARIEEHVAGILAHGIPSLVLGGDHSITLPILRAYKAVHGPMSVIQFDAHSDLWPDDHPERVDHGTFMYKAAKEGLVVPERSVQVGIRTVCDDTLGFNEITAREVHEAGPGTVAGRIKQIVGDAPCYLTFDIDALDPAFAPGTGTPVWGGLASWQASAILRDLAGIDLKGGGRLEGGFKEDLRRLNVNFPVNFLIAFRSAQRATTAATNCRHA